jgi:hypothetical protein
MANRIIVAVENGFGVFCHIQRAVTAGRSCAGRPAIGSATLNSDVLPVELVAVAVSTDPLVGKV